MKADRTAPPSAIERVRNRVRHWTTRHRQGPGEHVFVFSVPRSGSTWLAELIATQDRFKIVNEPFNLRMPVVREHLGLDDWAQLFEESSKPLMHRYLQRFVDDRDSDPRFKREIPFSEFWHFTTERMLFKILFAGEDDFGWFTRALGGRSVFLLRHPVPVSLSREDLPRLMSLCNGDFARNFSPQQLAHARGVIESNDRFQMAILDWCLQNAIPLRSPDPAWLVVSYEQMVLDPETFVSRLARHLALPAPQLMLDRMQRASASTSKSSAESRKMLHDIRDIKRRGESLIGRWRSRVPDEQVSRAFDTLEVFEIDYYARERVTPRDMPDVAPS